MVLSEAKEHCVKLGRLCRGVTCEAASNCSAMTGHQVLNQSATSYTKLCVFFGDETFKSSTLHAASQDVPSSDVAIVVLAHNRKNDLSICLDSLLRLPDAKLFQVYVSLDDDSAYSEMQEAVINISGHYGQEIGVWFVKPRAVNFAVDNGEQQKWFKTSTGKIAHHYWSAFERVFMKQQHDAAIFLEEDLVVAPDFLALFRSTAWVLAEDPSVWCVSAWNDGGFAFAVSDQCRLFRTTYFPGLGFLLQRKVWIRLREEWPSAPTMGWDYWMRTAFRRADKECIIPEVPRSRHESRKGSSIVTRKQVEYFELMALSQQSSSCDGTRPCNHFGNIDYLLKDTYEFWMHSALHKAERMTGSSHLFQSGQECTSEAINLGHLATPEDCAALVGLGECSEYFGFARQYPYWGCRCCRFGKKIGKEHPGKAWSIYRASLTGDPGKTYVFPYTFENYMSIAPSFGLQPEGMANLVPPDVRAEHYGLVVGKHLTSQAVVLLVDKRSPKPYLPVDEQLSPDPRLMPMAGAKGQSCDEVCQQRRMSCSAEQLHFLNNCINMTAHFGCKFCAHQSGAELPAYVADDFEPTVGQCLVTFISQLQCNTKHPSTRRLCPCMAQTA
ncbi:unnamed protein product [Durusdinium trenchii]